jgi:nucleoside-diphosphate-sugar epimerase
MSQLHVIFGTGPLGKHTATELLKRGERVQLVNRSGRTEGIPNGAELLRGDANDLETAQRLTVGASVVYQCAQPAYGRWAEEFPTLQRSILEATASAGARLVIADNLYMYGAPKGVPMREDHPYTATTKKGKVRAALATAALEAHRQGKLEVAILRGSNFFGPEDHVMFDLIFKPLLTGRSAQLLGRMDQPHTFTYAPDFGRALATIGMSDSGFGRVWHVPSNAPVTQNEFLQQLEAQLGSRAKRMVGSPLMLRFLGLFKPEFNETVEMMYEWMEPFVMDSTAFTQTFGLHATPLETALRETLGWAREQIAVPKAQLEAQRA